MCRVFDMCKGQITRDMYPNLTRQGAKSCMGQLSAHIKRQAASGENGFQHATMLGTFSCHLLLPLTIYLNQKEKVISVLAECSSLLTPLT